MSPLASRVDHVSFVVTDLDAALPFYVDILGCERIERPDLGFPGAWLRIDDTEVHLVTPVAGIDTGTPPPRPTGIANHVAFSVANLADARAELRAHGLDPKESDVGIAQLFVQDPSGNVIELIERATS